MTDIYLEQIVCCISEAELMGWKEGADNRNTFVLYIKYPKVSRLLSIMFAVFIKENEDASAELVASIKDELKSVLLFADLPGLMIT